MGKINTAANVSSAFSNRATARSGAETSDSVGKLATSDRHRELRERGLITHRSTPRDIAAVEAKLAAEMRGRMILQGSRYWNRRPYAMATVVAVAGAFLAVCTLAGARPAMALIFIVPTAVIATFLTMQARREQERRAQLIAKADWARDGSCAWCGRSDAHLVEDEEEHPRVAHAYELEQKIGEPLYVEV